MDGTALDDPLLCYLGVLENVPVSDALHGLNSLNSSDDVAVLFSYMGWSDLLQYMKLACALTCLQLYQIPSYHQSEYMPAVQMNVCRDLESFVWRPFGLRERYNIYIYQYIRQNSVTACPEFNGNYGNLTGKDMRHT